MKAVRRDVLQQVLKPLRALKEENIEAALVKARVVRADTHTILHARFARNKKRRKDDADLFA